MSTATTFTENLLIDGARVEASSGRTFDVFDPSTGERLATVAQATKADVDRAVASAHPVVGASGSKIATNVIGRRDRAASFAYARR